MAKHGTVISLAVKAALLGPLGAWCMMCARRMPDIPCILSMMVCMLMNALATDCMSRVIAGVSAVKEAALVIVRGQAVGCVAVNCQLDQG